MLRNYLKIAWRNLAKNKAFSVINIAGLATGLACFILIALYVADELSYDRFNKDAERIFRVNSEIKFGGNDLDLAVTSDPMGYTLKKDYPQVEQYVRLYNSGSKLIKKENEKIAEFGVMHADSTFFDMFTIPVIHGDPKTALNEPNTVVLSETAAKKYFNSTDVVGKTLEADETPYKITAVMKDIPHNSHFRKDFIFSMDNVNYNFGSFLSHNFNTYIRLQKGANYREFEKNFEEVTRKYILPQAQQFMQIGSMEEFTRAGNKLQYNLIPLTSIHLYSDKIAEMDANGSIQYVFIFSVVAFIILLLACINFMNLSTARSANRSKEVGIRKVLGTEKKNLINQFLTESVLMVIFSLILAIVIALSILPFFNNLANKELNVFSLLKPEFLVFLLILPFIVGLVAGSYPAFYLSKFQPIEVLKSNTGKRMKKSVLRSVLVVTQFAASIVLIICTIVVYRQLNFIQNKKLGFEKEQVLVINGTDALHQNADAFKNAVLQLPGVKSGSFSGYLPVSSSARSDNSFSKEAVMTPETGFNMQYWTVDHDYVSTMGMEIIKGRNFSRDFQSDSSAIIINEAAAAHLGYENPIGQVIYQAIEGSAVQTNKMEIIGVVKNFNFESLRKSIGPLSLRLGKSDWSASFKINTTDVKSLVAGVESQWKKMVPGMAFSYRFLDDAFDQMYRTEQRIGVLAMTFAILAIIIACLGLFGLAAYMAEQRTKEIGVRKILGASVSSITSMLSKDFLKLVLISSLIAFPIAWYAMRRWLQDFTDRVELSWWIFVLAAMAAVLIAVFTISFQSIRAAIANPVKSLRTE